MFNEIEKHIERNSKVISLQYGIGEIVSNFTMYDGVNDYLEVEYSVDGKSRYFCVKHLNDVRLISSKKAIESALMLMSNRLNDLSVENEFHESSVKFLDKDVSFIVRRIVELLRKENLSIQDNILLHSTIDSLVFEVEEVYKVNYNRARGIVGDYLRCA